MRELVVHLGPPKTGSTSVQLTLKASRSRLGSCGFAYAPPRDHIAHFSLVRQFNSDPERSGFVEGFDTGDGALSQVAPAPGSEILSSEDFVALGRGDVADLLSQWSPDRLRLVYVGRPPDAWVWSWWQQLVKTPRWPTLSGLVGYMKGHGQWFPAMTVSPWTGHDVETVAEYLELNDPSGATLERRFLELVGVRSNSIDMAGVRPRANVGMGVGETLLVAHAVNEVSREASDRVDEARFVPPGAVARTCLDIVENARPFAEMGAALEESDAYPTLLSWDVADEVCEYALAWSLDAEEAAESPIWTDRSKPLLRRAARTARDRIDQGRVSGPGGMGWPVESFGRCLPTPPQYWAMVRSIAVAALLNWRAASRE